MKLVQKWLANAIRIHQVGNRAVFKGFAGFAYGTFTVVGFYALLIVQWTKPECGPEWQLMLKFPAILVVIVTASLGVLWRNVNNYYR